MIHLYIATAKQTKQQQRRQRKKKIVEFMVSLTKYPKYSETFWADRPR